MYLLSLFIVLCAVTVSSMTHNDKDTTTDLGHPLLKRWYGVPKKPGQNTDMKVPFTYPWPVRGKEPHHQPVYYCYEDERSAKNLEPIVHQAILRWRPAMEHSALTIQLHPGTKGDPEVICSKLPKDAHDALIITDKTKDADPEWNESDECETKTQVGYIYESDTPWRHSLHFCVLRPDHPEGITKNMAIRSMTHELGHAIGLAHEHQRPDRSEHLWFYCKHLEGYDELERKVEIDEHAIWDDDDPKITTKAKISDCCNEYEAARWYLPAAVEFLRGNMFQEEGRLTSNFKSYLASDKIDLESVMLYDSTVGRSNDAIAKGKYILTKKVDNSPIWMGGSKDLNGFKISAGDIARVAQLYDKHTKDGEEAKKGELWGPVDPKSEDEDSDKSLE